MFEKNAKKCFGKRQKGWTGNHTHGFKLQTLGELLMCKN